jgi:hypothetical protein
MAYFALATIASMSSWLLSIEQTFYIKRQPLTLSTTGGAATGLNNAVAANVIYQFNGKVGLRSSPFFDVLQLLLAWRNFASD